MALQSLFGPPVEAENEVPTNIKEFHSTMKERKSADETVEIIKGLDVLKKINKEDYIKSVQMSN